MPPERSKPRPSMDGMNRSRSPRLHPDYRPDHELPAPKHRDLIAAHEPEIAQPAVAQPVAAERPVPAPSTKQPVATDKTVAASAQELSDKLDIDKIEDHVPAPKKRKKVWLIILVTFIMLIIAALAAVYGWYQSELAPVSTDTTKHVRVTIDAGTTPTAIAEQLEVSGVIKSKFAFTVYTKLSRTENSLKAGTYNLQPSLSTPAIVDHLVSGKQDTFSVTFLPGDTLASNRQKLIDLGYKATEVDAALGKAYNRPLFATKPAAADLEGYIFGDTYELDASSTPETIINRTFDEFEDVVTKENLVSGFKKQGLTLFQGITLASIVQREVTNPAPSKPNDDQRQVARVFLNRMAAGMTLGSDVTYQYAAKKLGVAPTPTLESPYNTRIHTGLPPGPISVPGVGALMAVANPASNDYLFFLSGDDDVTYFAKTDAQHQQNITQHCQKKCLIN